jgi:uncharacterized protein (TIGR02246 family)
MVIGMEPKGKRGPAAVAAVAAVLVVAGWWGARGGDPATASTAVARDRQAVVRLHAGIDQAWNAGDAPAFAARWTRDGTVVSPLGSLTSGRARIEKEQAAEFAGPMKGTTHRLTVARVYWPRPGVAVVDGTAEISGLTGPDGTAYPPLAAEFTSVCVHQGRAWLVAHMRSYVYVQ